MHVKQSMRISGMKAMAVMLWKVHGGMHVKMSIFIPSIDDTG